MYEMCRHRSLTNFRSHALYANCSGIADCENAWNAGFVQKRRFSQRPLIPGRKLVIFYVSCTGKRDATRNARPQIDDNTTEKARAMKMERLKMIEPNAAPANIATTAAIRRCKRGLVPRARDESAAIPVIVNVSTVVVRSGMANLRTA